MGGLYPPWLFVSRESILGLDGGSFHKAVSEGSHVELGEAPRPGRPGRASIRGNSYNDNFETDQGRGDGVG